MLNFPTLYDIFCHVFHIPDSINYHEKCKHRRVLLQSYAAITPTLDAPSIIE